MKKLTKIGMASLLLTTILGCAESTSTKATPERLSGLLDSGLTPEARTKAEERLQKILSAENATGKLSQSYDADGAGTSMNLAALFANTVERNPDIGHAAQAINRADAERMNAIYGYLPQVTFNYTLTNVDQQVVQTDNEVFQRGQATYPVTNYGAELRQPIFDLGRIYNIQLRNAARSAAEVEYISAVQAALYEAFDAYVDAAQSKARIQSMRSQIRLVSQQAASEQALLDTGLTIDINGRTYSAQLASLAADEAVESSRYSEALSRLSYVSGTVVTDVETIKGGSQIRGAERNTTPEAAFAAAEQSNPALLATAVNVTSTDLGRRQALATDFSPVLEAFARYEDETREGSRFGGGSQTKDTNVGFRLTIPIFNAQGRGYASSVETVDLRDAALEYYAIKRQLRTDITSTLKRMQDLSQAIGQTSRGVSEVSANVRSEQARVDAGESLDLAVLGRQLAEVSARERLDYLQLEYLRAWGKLQYLTGADLRRQGL